MREYKTDADLITSNTKKMADLLPQNLFSVQGRVVAVTGAGMMMKPLQHAMRCFP